MLCNKPGPGARPGEKFRSGHSEILSPVDHCCYMTETKTEALLYPPPTDRRMLENESVQLLFPKHKAS
uniref:Uncharacterized protein n=1 Tax=Romanomermis culicivorax TaxID=13658 RepID=A0A915IEQ4_ROMCU